MAEVQNPFTDPKKRKEARGRFQQALQPQIREGTERVMSQVSPFQTGRRGARLMRDVERPAQQALSQFEIGQEEKGQQFAAESPFRTAQLTGELGGQQTLAGKGLGLQAELGRGQLGLQRGALTGQLGGQQTLAGKQFEVGSKERASLEKIATGVGMTPEQLELLAQSDPAKFNRLLQSQIGLLDVNVDEFIKNLPQT